MIARLGFGLVVATLLALIVVASRVPDGRAGLPKDPRPGVGSAPARATTAAPVRAVSTTAPARRAGSAQPPPAERPVADRLYRWRDARGSIHIESEPPPPGVHARIIHFERPAPRVPGDDDAPRAAALPERIERVFSNPLSVYTPEGFDDLLDHVEETAARLYERQREMEALKSEL